MKRAFDVAVIGGGPVGCVAALSFAQRGAGVLLLEAAPETSVARAAVWIHPPALALLRDLGVALPAAHCGRRGFVLFPEDGTPEMTLPYAEGVGAAIDDACLLKALRAACAEHDGIEYLEPAEATNVEGQRLAYRNRRGNRCSVEASLIVGATGRDSMVHRSLGLRRPAAAYSRMAVVKLEDVALRHPDYAHIFLGGPGPATAFGVGDGSVSLGLDVPLALPFQQRDPLALWDAFRGVLPIKLERSLLRAAQAGQVTWQSIQSAPRVSFGRPGLALVGDAVGAHHPLTALGMTLGFGDAKTLAQCGDFASYRRTRSRSTVTSEMLAVALYEIFADSSDEAVALRQAIYTMWRSDPAERSRTMAYLCGSTDRPLRYAYSMLRALSVATATVLSSTLRGRAPRHAAQVSGALLQRSRRLIWGAWSLSQGACNPRAQHADTTESPFAPALKASSPQAEVTPLLGIQEIHRARQQDCPPSAALERGVSNLLGLQAEDGSWEGECVWNPMLPAQYVMACHLMGVKIPIARRRRILRQFEVTQSASGGWGMHELSEPFLFVTTLVYVASRILGVASDEPLLAPAGEFLRRAGGAVAIPSWGKFWLALLGLYEWQGVNPVLPEVWRLPTWLAAHPRHYYCHTRLIYQAMACLYGESTPPPDAALVQQLRTELFPTGYESVDWNAARHELRREEIYTPPSAALRKLYDALRLFDRNLVDQKARGRLRASLRADIRFELHSTDFTCISPVNGLLSLLALQRHDARDPDLLRGIERLSGWMWEDDERGTRIAGARSASWDTAFAMQALNAASFHANTSAALERADRYLAAEQIAATPAQDHHAHHRIDPSGGYCFAGKWHGWPVSDCTAEAVLARLGCPVAVPSQQAMRAAVDFILRTQCPTGGFGSYEPQRSRVPLEWLNPAEMFGDSMTEHAYVECTASCLAALAAYKKHFAGDPDGEIDAALTRGAQLLRDQQEPDGSWSGNWGVHFIYGTLFGIRGLVAAGCPKHDPAIRKACRWLLRRQHADGGWGESHEGSLSGRYADHATSQNIQTAWALSALLEAEDPNYDCLERGAYFLASRQQQDGSWPKEEPAGVFFHTALLHYELYRSYFPVWALAEFETRRLARALTHELPASPTQGPPRAPLPA